MVRTCGAHTSAFSVYLESDMLYPEDEPKAAFDKLMAAPARTPRGVLLKIVAGIEEQGDDPDAPAGLESDTLGAIRRDLERLAGEA